MQIRPKRKRAADTSEDETTNVSSLSDLSKEGDDDDDDVVLDEQTGVARTVAATAATGSRRTRARVGGFREN